MYKVAHVGVVALRKLFYVALLVPYLGIFANKRLDIPDCPVTSVYASLLYRATQELDTMPYRLQVYLAWVQLYRKPFTQEGAYLR